MECFIYKSSKKYELYLFIRKEGDFESIPAALMSGFGTPQFVMRLELTPERKLARSNVTEVMQNLSTQGFHLQLPPKNPAIDTLQPNRKLSPAG